MEETTPAPAILLGKNAEGNSSQLLLRMANRHGLIAGATGTGKTVTLQVLAEGFSKAGVPVFTADVKGDLAGISQGGLASAKLQERIDALSLKEFSFSASPVTLWDLAATQGIPVRTTISEMGPLLLGRMLDLNETQQSILEVAFRVADDQGLLLLDGKDIRELLQWIAGNLSELRPAYGNIAPASIGAIQRRLLALEEAGVLQFFGEPALSIQHIMQRDFSGRGVVSVLDASNLIHDPRLYTTFLLWLLSELFEELDEIGDTAAPRLVFFFDEAHLLFNNAPKPLLERIETMIRLIRSKGVGVYFVTQDPSDVPESVLGQLGNRVQHALRAYTPSARKNIRAVADAFRENPAIDTATVVTELKVGEALVSLLDADGAPTVVERVLICPPQSRIGALSQPERVSLIQTNPFYANYQQSIDRESAFEILKARRESEEKASQEAKASKQSSTSGSSRRQSMPEAFAKSILRSFGSSIGRQIARGILGSILKSAKR